MTEICLSSTNYYIKAIKESKCYHFFVYSKRKYPIVQNCIGKIIDVSHGASYDGMTYYTEIIFDKYGGVFKFYDWEKNDYFQFVNWINFCELDRQQKFKYIELGNTKESPYHFKISKTKDKIYVYRHESGYQPDMRVFKYNNVIFNEVYKNNSDYFTTYFYSGNGTHFCYNMFTENDAQKLTTFLKN